MFGGVIIRVVIVTSIKLLLAQYCHIRNKGNRELRYNQKSLSMEKANSNLQVKELREKLRDRKLKIVADRIGMTYSGLSRIMRGGVPSEKTIKKLEEYFKEYK